MEVPGGTRLHAIISGTFTPKHGRQWYPVARVVRVARDGTWWYA